MEIRPAISLDQWRALLAVVDQGGYAQAATAIHRSQSAVSYSIQKIEHKLGLKLFEIQGRRAVLTEPGRTLQRRARILLDDAQQIEALARRLAQGWEETLRVAVDAIVPLPPLFAALEAFNKECQTTRIELLETVLSGGDEALDSADADLAILGRLAPGRVGRPICPIEFVAVAHPQHPLHLLGRELLLHDLKAQRQLVVRDSGRKQRTDAGWLGSEKRWTVSSMQSSIEAVSRGLGFAWLPRQRIREQLASGLLKPLPLVEGGRRSISLQLVHADPDHIGPAAQRLAELIEQELVASCGLDGQSNTTD